MDVLGATILGHSVHKSNASSMPTLPVYLGVKRGNWRRSAIMNAFAGTVDGFDFHGTAQIG
jgi:hypothetical protein